jgi:hypothetical protein
MASVIRQRTRLQIEQNRVRVAISGRTREVRLLCHIATAMSQSRQHSNEDSCSSAKMSIREDENFETLRQSHGCPTQRNARPTQPESLID